MNKEWEIKRLDEVCNILNGGTPKTGVKEYWDGNVKWITPKDMGKLTSKFVDDTPRKITSLGLQKSSAKLIPSNSLILSTRAPIGHLSINTSEMATNQGCRGIIPLSDINIQYLYYFLSDSIDLLNSLGTGATFRELSTKALSSVKIPLPPIPEQKRIVKILDEAFAAISTAKANAEKNLQNSRELFDSYLNKVFENPGEDWEEKKLEEIYDVRDGTHDSPKYQPEGYALITSKNLKRDGLNFDKVKYISQTDYININKRSVVHKGDVLFAMIGTIGNPIVIEIEPNFAIKNVALFKVSPEQDSYFLKYYLESDVAMTKMISEAKGTTQKFVGLGYLRNFPILVPHIDEQRTIVKNLKILSDKTKKLGSIYQQKLADLEELKKSILQKAFDGEI